MKSFKTLGLIAALFAATIAILPTHALALGFGKERFQKMFYFAHTATGKGTGSNSANAHAIATDTSFYAIPANTIVEKVYLILDVAVTGTSAFSVGDTDSATGYIPAASVTLGTPGLYAWSAASQGSYLEATASNLYQFPAAKYYSASGKYLTVTNTTTNTAGSFRVVMEGYNAGL